MLKELRMNDNGKLTLEGRVVRASPVGLPELGFYAGEINEANHIVEKNGERESSPIPHFDSINHRIGMADAYVISIGKVPYIDQTTSFGLNVFFPKVVVAVQFYKLVSKEKK